ncbi:MAG: hypothetical protein Fur0010_27080 [Bdellovibrio sp.]
MDMNRFFNPSHLQLIEPLVKWKILSLTFLNEASYLTREKNSNFYKTISKLESDGLLGSFIDPNSKEKYVYLTKLGIKTLGANQLTPINEVNMFHDSFVSEIGYLFSNLPFSRYVVIEHEILQSNPMIGHRPDAYLEGHHKNDFRLAFEVEFTAKSKERIRELFNYYTRTQFFNNALFFFGHKGTFDTYVRTLDETISSAEKKKFLMMYSPSLYRRKYNIFQDKVFHDGKLTTLGKLFGINPITVEHHSNEGGIHSN